MSRRRSADRRWAVYARLSPKDNYEVNGYLGTERQVFEARAMFERRDLGGTIVGEYVDDDISAYKRGRRPAYERLLDDVKNGVVNGVLAMKSDRISRDDLRGLEDLIDLFDAYDVAVETVNSGSYDLTTATGKAQARQLGVWARLESDQISERIRDKHSELARRGLPSGGPRAYGYEKDLLTKRDGEAAVVAEIVERVAAGEALTRIADSLNERGLSTARGGTWRATTVRAVAVNPRYIARRIAGGEDVGPAEWPALVDEATWRRANAVLRDPARTTRRAGRRNLLTGGLIVCGRCGARLFGKATSRRRADGTPTRIYACLAPRDGGCGRLSVDAEEVEALVVERLIDVVESEEYAAALGRSTGAEVAAADRLGELERELEAWTADAKSGVISRTEYLSIRLGVVERIAAARAALGAEVSALATARYAGRPGALRADWESEEALSLDERQAIIRAALAPVVVRPGVGGRFDESRVEIGRAV